MLFLLLAFLVFLADLASKAWVHFKLPLMTLFYPHGGIPVFKDFFGINFSIVHQTNKGAAWGLFAYLQDYLLAFRIVTIGLILGYLFFFNKTAMRRFPLLLILSGAIGNVLDYFLYGHVVDMFYFTFWGYSYPVFNIADSAIFCGVAMLLLQSYSKKVYAV
ncbi:MAG TPA: signal peptidase II [Rhabdochlamydiaceae bacterium]|nr:signal peptidase II [Rhabdochlamydiaceae bacterium]